MLYRFISKSMASLLAICLSSSLLSCAGKDKEEPDDQPVEQPATQPVATAPKPAADPTAMFRTPKDDNLPTDDQLKQGSESSIGTGVQPIKNPPEGPSTTVKPPAPPKPDEDQLDPGE